MEDLQQLVTPTERNLMLKQACLTDFTVGNVRTLIADMVEMAYLAGANKVNLRRLGSSPEPDVTGENLVLARAFVKDKGLRI